MERTFDRDQPVKKRKKHRFLRFIFFLILLNCIFLGSAYYFAGRTFGYEEVNRNLALAKEALSVLTPSIKERILDKITYIANFL